jgi:predicted exporter
VALVFSGFPGLAQLGVFSVAGLVARPLATRFVLPALMPQGSRGMGLRRPLGRAARAALAVLPRLRWPVLAAGRGRRRRAVAARRPVAVPTWRR